MIRPDRARSIACVARLVTRYAAVRLVSMTDVNASSLIRSSSPSWVTPAFETSTSTGPNCSSTALKAASTLSVERTSHDTPNSPSGGGELL